MKFQPRSVIAREGSAFTHRIVWVEPGKTWIMSLDSSCKAWPVLISEQELDLYTEVRQEPTIPLGAAALKKAQRHYEAYGGGLNHIAGLLTEQGRSKAFADLKKLNPKLSSATFYRLVRRWLRDGCVLACLAPQWKGAKKRLEIKDVSKIGLASAIKHCRGVSEKLMGVGYEDKREADHTQCGKPRQRFPKHAPSLYEVDQPTLRVFSEYFKHKLATPGMSLKSEYGLLMKEVFATISPTQTTTFWPRWVVPSYRVFEYWFMRMTTHRARRVAIKGEKNFELNERSLLGQGVSKAYAAGTVGELDATVWNVDIVSELPGAKSLGPPIVFRIRDKDTGELLGISVGLESASWMGAATSIANCVEDKVSMCKALDIVITYDQWPVKGLPATITADCGETHNHKPNRFINTTSTNLKNLQAARGDLKPGSESDFNTLQVSLNGMTPGAVIKSYEQTSTKKWRLKGSMTLRQFTRVLILAELIRMTKPRLGLQLPADMINDGVDSSPGAMWHWSMTHMPLALRAFDADVVKLSLLDTSRGSITEHGVEFKGIYYLCDDLAGLGAFEIARRRGTTKVVIGFDPRLVDSVFILEGNEQDPSRYVRCEINEGRRDQRDFKGKTFREVQQVIRRGERLNVDAESDARSTVSSWEDEQKRTIERSIARTKAQRSDFPQSDSALHNGREAARTIEKNALSPRQAIVPAKAATTAADAQSDSGGPNGEATKNSTVVPMLASRTKKLSAFAALAAASKMKPTKSKES